MNVTRTAIPEVLVLEPKVFGDARGFFLESYNEKVFREATGLDVQFATYPTTQKLHPEMLHDVNRWTMRLVTGA